MHSYLKKRYAMSDHGASDLVKAIITHSFVNLSMMLPMTFAFTFLQQMVSQILGMSPMLTLSLWQYSAIILVFLLLQFIAARLDYKATYVTAFEESANKRVNLAEKLRTLPLAFFGKKDIADLSATIMSDVTMSEQLFSHIVPQIYAAIISTSIIFLMLLSYNVQMTIALFWVLPVAFAIFFFTLKKQRKLYVDLFATDRVVIDKMQDGLDLVEEIKLYNKEQAYAEDMDTVLDRLHKQKLDMELGVGVILTFSHAILRLGLASVVLWGARLLITGEIEPFTYFVYLIISGSIYNPIIDLVNNLAELIFLDNLTARMNEIEAMPIQQGASEFLPNNFDLKFDKVEFSYEEGVKTLDKLSFIAKQGQVTALVGPSGGGKSTTARCSARFWDIDAGVITLGGVDISTIDPEVLLKYYAIVFQDVTLFNTSIRENIRLGKQDATDDEVMAVAKLAQCDEFVTELADGYDTEIGENGTKLSGGERQRISIARAMLKNAPIILLDEATASLDAENESKVQRALSELIKDKTVIVIAHRMRTILAADNIVVIAEGKIVEQGPAQQLLDNKNIFYHMYHAQLGSA